GWRKTYIKEHQSKQSQSGEHKHKKRQFEEDAEQSSGSDNSATSLFIRDRSSSAGSFKSGVRILHVLHFHSGMLCLHIIPLLLPSLSCEALISFFIWLLELHICWRSRT